MYHVCVCGLQFIVSHTNKRQDEWGGAYENRIRFAVEIVRQMRAAVGEDFIIVFRLSMLDLVKDGSSWDEIVQLANAIRDAGATIINTGIGWHEARIPTIATQVPRGGFAWYARTTHVQLSQARAVIALLLRLLLVMVVAVLRTCTGGVAPRCDLFAPVLHAAQGDGETAPRSDGHPVGRHQPHQHGRGGGEGARGRVR